MFVVLRDAAKVSHYFKIAMIKCFLMCVKQCKRLHLVQTFAYIKLHFCLQKAYDGLIYVIILHTSSMGKKLNTPRSIDLKRLKTAFIEPIILLTSIHIYEI